MQIDFATREGRHEQGRLIQRAAEEAGLSLESLAREIGCSRALIYQYVSGATLAQPDRIQRIAERTGKPLLFFYGGEALPDNLRERVVSLQTLLSAQLGPADLQGALATCEQLIALSRQAGDVRAEATARTRQVGAFLQRGEPARALDALEIAKPFFQQHQLGPHLRAAEQNRGHALLALGRVEEAEAAFAAVVAQGDWAARWQGTVSLAAVAEHQGRYFRALSLLDDALALAEVAPDPKAAQTLRLYVAGNLANIHLACGDHLTAIREAEEAQDLAIILSNRDQYIEALLTLGVCQREAGQLAHSRLTLESAARWARLSEDAGREALALAELAHTLVAQGRYEEARDAGKDGLRQGIAAGTRRAELSAQLALAAGYQRGGLPQEGRYHAVQAWEISMLLGQPYAQALALVTLGEAHQARGDADEARRAFVPARDLADSIGARVPAVEAILGLAQLGERAELDHALNEARELGVPGLLWMTHLQCGIAAETAGNLAEAEVHYREAIIAMAALRHSLADEPHGDTYLEYRLAWEPHLRLARVLRLQGDEEGAEQAIVDAEWPPLAALEGDTV